MKRFLVLILSLCASLGAQSTFSGASLSGVQIVASSTSALSWNPNSIFSNLSANNTSNCYSLFETCAPQVGTTSNQSTYPGMSEARWKIANIARSGGVVTVTLTKSCVTSTCSGAAFAFTSGMNVIINGVTDSTNYPNGTYAVASVSGDTLTYSQGTGTTAASSGGTAARIWPNSGNEDAFIPPPANVANFDNDGVRIQDLMYPGQGGNVTTKVVVHVVPFQHCPATGSCLYSARPNQTTNGSHVMVGYAANNTNQVAAQIAAMKRLGISVAAMDEIGTPFSGRSTTRADEDGVAQKYADALAGQSDFSFMMVLEQAGWNTTSSCRTFSTSQPSCIEKVLDCTFDWYNTAKGTNFSCVAGSGNGATASTMAGSGFFASSAYAKFNGKPVVQSFLSESDFFGACTTTAPCTTYNNGTPTTCTSSGDCWTKIWAGVSAHIAGYSVQPCVLWRNTWTHAALNCGSLKWINPTSDPTNHDGVNMSGYASWLATAKTSTKVAMGEAFAHNSHAQSSFQDDKLWIGSDCGMTWVKSLGFPALNGFSIGKQLPFVQLLTWNDSEQGTTLETGINNCYSISGSLSSSTVTYSLSTSNAAKAPLPLTSVNTTLHHIAVLAKGTASNGKDTLQLDQIAVPPSGSGTVDLTAYSAQLPTGTYTIYLKLVPVAGMQTKLTSGMTYVVP